MMQTPPTVPPGELGPNLARDDVPCLQCGYNLRGLSADGVCPECGAPVARSLRGELLVYSGSDYTASLHRGVALILTAIIAEILLGIATFGVGISTAMGAAGGTGALEALLQVAWLAASIALVVGWWMFSAPDPAMLGRDTGDTPRKIVRIVLVIQLAATLVSTAAQTVPASLNNPLNAGLVYGLGIASTIAFIVGFFAQMLYVKWLAPRLPSERVFKRAGTLMWLGPLLYTVGALLLLLGPLIALVLYWNMLDWVRKDLKRIRAEQAAEGLTG